MRGEVWTIRDEGYASKPRPAVIIQDDRFDRFSSITVCPLTSYGKGRFDEVRPMVYATAENGLHSTSLAMVDKVLTLDKSRLSKCVGRLSDKDMRDISAQIRRVLGL